MVSEEKSDIILIFVPLQVSFPPTCYRTFSLFLIFCSLRMMPRCWLVEGGRGAFILLGVLWASWTYDLVCDINLGEILSYYCFRYFFCLSLFLLFLAFPLCIYLCSCPTVVRYSMPSFFPPFFFPVCFFLLKVSTEIASSSEILSSAASSLIISPSKTFLISVTVFFISFWFFLRITSSLLILASILACCLLIY